MKKRILPIIIIALVLLSSCNKGSNSGDKRYQATFLTLFDTVTTILGYSSSEEEFSSVANAIHEELLSYHQLYNIYEDYPGVNNIKTINDQAGIAPVEVDRKIIDLLFFCKDMYEKTGGVVNVAMGSVLELWHEAREYGINNPDSAFLPDMSKLEEAKKHTDFSSVIIDEEASTVFLADPLMSLDVGAVAKGFAVEEITKKFSGNILISVGGNVSASSSKPDGSDWVVGLQDSEDLMGKNKHTVYLSKGAVVTSGDYQRYYTVEGVPYHHIIDPETLMPGDKWKAVSILADNSAIADVLSTALFLLSLEDGEILLESFGAEAIWTDKAGNEFFSSGFSERMRT